MRHIFDLRLLPVLIAATLAASIPSPGGARSADRNLLLVDLDGGNDFPDDSNLAKPLVASKQNLSISNNQSTGDIMVTEALHPDGYRVKKYLGPVVGVSIRFAGIGPTSFGKAFTGGKMEGLERAYLKSAGEAKDDMIARARALGANAVLGTRLLGGYVWFGDAVVVEPTDQAVAPRSKEEG